MAEPEKKSRIKDFLLEYNCIHLSINGTDLGYSKKALSSNKDQFLNQLRNAKFTEFMSSNNAVKVENEAPSKVEEEKTVKKAPAKKAASTTAKKTTTSTKKASSTTKTTKKAAPKAE